jgi:hypothetical protein
LAALLLIATKERDNQIGVLEFAAAMQHPKEVPVAKRGELSAALKCAEALNHRREANALSGKNVEPIMELVFGYWNLYTSKADGRVTPVSREDFLKAA